MKAVLKKNNYKNKNGVTNSSLHSNVIVYRNSTGYTILKAYVIKDQQRKINRVLISLWETTRKKVIETKIPFTKITKAIEHLGINVTKDVQNLHE